MLWSLSEPQHAEALLELRAHRQVQPLAGRRPANEPSVIDFQDIAAVHELLECAQHCLVELRIVLAEHYPIGILGQEITDDDQFALRATLGNRMQWSIEAARRS